MLHCLLDLMNPVTEPGQPRVIRHDASFPSSTALHGFPLVAAASRPRETVENLAGVVGTADLDIHRRIAVALAMAWLSDGIFSYRCFYRREFLRPYHLFRADLSRARHSEVSRVQLVRLPRAELRPSGIACFRIDKRSLVRFSFCLLQALVSGPRQLPGDSCRFVRS